MKYNLPLDSLGLPLDQKLVGNYLKPLGYTSGLVGKWHEGNASPFHPNKRGFDYFWGFLWGSSNYFTDKNRDFEENGKMLNATELPYTTDAIGDKSVAFIKANAKNPFFLYVSFNAPHTPMQAKPELVERFMKELNNKGRALNAAITWNMDENVGKIYAALEESSLLDNTILIFTNDNGGQVQASYADNFPLRGMKGDVYEGGIRVPMAISWKGKIKPGTVCETPVTTLDFIPTFLAAAGASLKNKTYAKLEGQNLLSIINAGAKQPDRTLYWYVDVDKGCIRRGDYKMVFLPGKTPELYNLGNDIGETNNLVNLNTQVAESLQSDYMKWKNKLPPLKWYPVKNANTIKD